MGFDVSFHPIGEAEIREWYFDALQKLKNGNENALADLAQSFGMDEFYVDKYLNILKVGLATDETDDFDKTHSYYIAVIQGFFRKFYYTRGAAFTFMIEEKPAYRRYTKSWDMILNRKLTQPVSNQITENYCGGVYIPHTQVKRLLADYETEAALQADLEKYFSHGRLNVFLNVLKFAAEEGVGVLEATEVLEPNPLNLNNSACYSNLFNCDVEGPLLYKDAAMEQLAELNINPGDVERITFNVDGAGNVTEDPISIVGAVEVPDDGDADGHDDVEVYGDIVNEDDVAEAAPIKLKKKGFFAQLFGGKGN